MNNRFVFVVPYYNASSDITKTILSMMAQSYDNWRAVIINDMSTDDSQEKVNSLINSTYFKGRFTSINNEEKHGEVKNTLQAIKSIDDDEIVCRLDGGDWLIENDLLWIMNQVYQDKRLAVAWTAHRWGYTSQNISGPIVLAKNQTVYQHKWVSSHMKSFRCKELRTVPEKNFLTDDGEFIMIACDQAVFLPMMHKAALESKNLAFIPIVGYHYNINLEDKHLFTSERSIRQKHSAEWIRARGYIE